MSVVNQLRVLVVDDTSTSRLLIRDGLEEIGLRHIFFAHDGEQALQFMMATPAHLIISDLNMPKLDGLGLLKAIRNYTPTRRVPFRECGVREEVLGARRRHGEGVGCIYSQIQ